MTSQNQQKTALINDCMLQ